MTSNKKNILILSDWYSPAYKAGGPITSIKNLVREIHPLVNIDIITGAYDLNETKPLNVPLNTWYSTPEARILYLTREHLNYKFIKTLLKEKKYDAVYFNSLFSVPFTLGPLWYYKFQTNKPKLVLAPRGMLGAGALQIKPLKKSIFLALSKAIGLYKSIHWHATAEEEKQEIIQHFNPLIPIKVIPNMAQSSNLTWESIASKKCTEPHRRFLFCSRISPKKNLLSVLQWFQHIKEPYTLSIVGPSDDVEYFKLCTDFVGQHMLHQVQFLGEKRPEELESIYLHHDVFILPTRHENFGHVIIEAMLHGCPVILSDQTPWRNLKEKNVGWDLPLQEEFSFVHAISECISISREGYFNMSKSAHEFALQHTQTKALKQAYLDLLTQT